MRWTSLLALLVLVGCPNFPTNERYQCGDDSDCPPGKVCIDDECQDAVTPDAGCPATQSCVTQLTGVCQAGTISCGAGDGGFPVCVSDVLPGSQVEVCNQLDDDCDGNTDEGANDDCDDGLWCNGLEFCDTVGRCVAGLAPNCDDGVFCTLDLCFEPEDRCVSSPDDRRCDDGVYCNGVETCTPTAGCQPGTMIDCDDGKSCTVDTCDEANSECVNARDDGRCNDGNSCTTDTCNLAGGSDPDTGCTVQDNTVSCSVGICTGTCSNGSCSCPCTTSAECDDSIGCTLDTCPAGTCLNTPDDAFCDNTLGCDGVEVCSPTSSGANTSSGCLMGVPPDCDDGVGCSSDSCNEPDGSCTRVPDDSVCDNGAFCDGLETCSLVFGCQAGTLACDDGIPCTTDACDETQDQCVNTPDDSQCDDGVFCNGSESCGPTVCVSGTPPCEDGIVCTTDTCDEGTDTCTSLPDDAQCDDGNVCTDDVCNPAVGCENPDNTASCTVGVCTLTCSGGACPCGCGTAADCTDSFSCTTDTCDAGGNCVHTPDNAVCDDQAPCNGVEFCDPGDPNKDPQTGCIDPPDTDCTGRDQPCNPGACDGSTGTCINQPATGTSCGVGCLCDAGVKTENDCTDGIDNDGDGDIDAVDDDCCTSSQGVESTCGDGLDNDCDGDTDCDDPDCNAQSCGATTCCDGSACVACSGSCDQVCDLVLDCSSCPTDCTSETEICNNNQDDNCNGATDCMELSCDGKRCNASNDCCNSGECGSCAGSDGGFGDGGLDGG